MSPRAQDDLETERRASSQLLETHVSLEVHRMTLESASLARAQARARWEPELVCLGGGGRDRCRDALA